MDKMKNTSTTLELPEGSKATIAWKNIDGKNYLVVEVEERKPEWRKFKRRTAKGDYWLMLDRYVPGSNSDFFDSLSNNTSDGNRNWMSAAFRIATKEEAEFFKWLRDEKGLEWNGEKLVEIPKRGDFVIVWDKYPQTAKIELFKEYNKYMVLDKVGTYYRYKTKTDSFWIHAIKWDGTKEQYEKVLRGEL